MKHILAVTALSLAVACSGTMPAVHLEGDPVSISRLAGSWQGEYWGSSSGRRGTINLSLQAGSDSLYGDVLMVDQTGNSMRPADTEPQHMLHVHTVRGLRIDFVSLNAGHVRGMLEPYISPDCSCTVTSTFLGTVTGDVIDGTFETAIKSSVITRGFWHMSRTPTGARLNAR